MPELPEVEIMTRNLRGWLGGQSLSDVELNDPAVLREGAVEMLGEQPCVRRVFRRAKYSCIEFEDHTLVLHFRMTGKVIRWPWDADRHRIRFQMVSTGVRVGFSDTRRLGEAWLVPKASVDAFFEARNLGPDAWPERREGAWWAERFSRKRGPVKPALLDQACVAGIGNIAASEICWRARISPHRACSALTLSDWDAIARHTVVFMSETIAAEASEEIVYVNAGGANPFDVYGREGEPCPSCGSVLSRFSQSGRSTFFCAACQR